MNEIARIISTGDDQSVVLPEGYHFDGTEVRISRDGDRVVLEAVDTAIDPDTGLTIARMRELIQEGLDSGDDEVLDMDAIKRDARREWETERAR